MNRGTTEILYVTSEPSGAEVRLSNQMTGKTPAVFEVSRKEDLEVVISKPGYLEARVRTKPVVRTGGGLESVNSVLWTGAIGLAADSQSGALLDHKPNPVHAVLKRR